MKKIVLPLIIVSVFSLLVSCEGKETFFPDLERGLSVEIRSDVRSESPDIVLQIEKTGGVYRADVTEPDDLSNVSLLYENGALTLFSDTVELPLGESTAAGLSVVFKTLDDLSVNGVPKNGRLLDIDGFQIEFGPSSAENRAYFEVTGAGLKRSFVLRWRTETETERDPVSSG